jgi:general secretion pathway protein K
VVLLFIAVLGFIAETALEDIRFAMRRTSNGEALAQARWYGLGAETVARRRLAQRLAQDSDRVALDDWDGRSFDWPVEQGMIRARLDDRPCFNLNSLVSDADGPATADPRGVAQFAVLLEGIGRTPVEALQLSATLADWIDADGETAPGGAEDEVYASGPAAYRTAGGRLADESELRAVRGFTPAIYDQLRPLVCALPQGGQTQLNVNALRPADAPLVVAVREGKGSPARVRRAIVSRPPGGWPSLRAFLEAADLTQAAQGGGADALTLKSRFFEFSAEVDYRQAQVSLRALLQATDDGHVRTVARQWVPLGEGVG